jgi:transcriptional regulator with XRE-family HTH domain
LCRVHVKANAPQWGVPLDSIQSSLLKHLGDSVRRERVKRKMTQEELAELVNLNARTVQKIEAGTTNLLITTVARIRKALGCSWDDLLGEP